jgi:hypothetical protein
MHSQLTAHRTLESEELLLVGWGGRGWRPLALVCAEGEPGEDVDGGVCCGWHIEAEDGRVIIKP